LQAAISNSSSSQVHLDVLGQHGQRLQYPDLVAIPPERRGKVEQLPMLRIDLGTPTSIFADHSAVSNFIPAPSG
jgi:hypothetical protein